MGLNTRHQDSGPARVTCRAASPGLSLHICDTVSVHTGQQAHPRAGQTGRGQLGDACDASG